jgi:hypothetical protein
MKGESVFSGIALPYAELICDIKSGGIAARRVVQSAQTAGVKN